MALLYFDGFDHYGNNGDLLADLSPNTWVMGTTTGSHANSGKLATMPSLGGQGLRFYGASSSSRETPIKILEKTISSGDTLGIGFHFYLTSISTVGNYGPTLVGFSTGQNDSPVTRLDFNGSDIRFYTGDSHTSGLVASSPAIIATDTLYHAEIKIHFHATEGTVEFRLNGETVFNETNLNTSQAIGKSRLRLLSSDYDTFIGFFGVIGFIKNLVIWDDTGSANNDFLGERSVVTLFPNSDTADADWTLSTGSDGYDLINDVPPDAENNYISSSTITDRSSFGLEELPDPNIKITAVQATVKGQKTDAGAGNIQFGITTNSVDSLSDSTNMVFNQDQYYTHIVETNPDTSADWEVSDIDDLQITVVRSAAT